jgi:large subunit ribosomal protein L4e
MVKIQTIKGSSKEDVELPKVFNTPLRRDLINRAVLSEQSKKRQKQGRFPLAGRLVTARSMGPGRGIAKVPRTTGHGTHHGGRGTLVHSTVGGRMLFPTTTEKIIVEKMNRKEHRIALKSAIAATANGEIVGSRGHVIDGIEQFPFLVEDKITEVMRTSELKSILETLGFSGDLNRVSKRKIRAGRGKTRGRRYKTKVGPLIVVSNDCNLLKAGDNLLGVDIVKVQDLTVEALAPGGDPARLTLWTKSALEHLESLSE